MFRSFCVGAIAGFLFGSSKKGHDVREGIDGFLTELTSSDALKALDEKKNELSEMASNTFSKFTGKSASEAEEKNGSNNGKKNGKQENSVQNAEPKKASGKEKEEQNFEPQSESKDPLEFSGTAEALDADKAQELADKLGAKPSAPEDENLAAFSHHDDELKSA